MKPPLIASLPLIAAIAWTVHLAIDGAGRDQGSVFLIGLGLMLSAVVSTVGMVVVGGRWARRLGLGVVTGCLLIAITTPVDASWIVALALTGLAAIALFSPTVTGGIRKLPAASGPPSRAVLLPLLLVGTPYVIGLVSWYGTAWPEIVVGVSAPISAFLYARAIWGGLLVVRIGWPVLALALAVQMDWPSGVAAAIIALGTLTLAWHPSVKVSFRPPRETGSAYPIPPELTPPEILDAAQIDEKGRRL